MGNKNALKDSVIIAEKAQRRLFGNLHLEHRQRHFLDEISFKFQQLGIVLPP